MEFRKATSADLPQLAEVYARIYRDMQENGVFLWDENYPAGAAMLMRYGGETLSGYGCEFRL